MATRSVIDPSGTGTRSESPSRRPSTSGSTSPVARAAPVVVGTMLIAAPRDRRGSLCRASTRCWSSVYAWTVVMKPCSMPKASSSTLARTARQFVVHDALETTKSRAGSKVSSLTPTTKVASASLAGAEMITRRAPALMWAAALSRLVRRPVLSITTSMPSSRQGSSSGWGSINIVTGEEPTIIVSCSTDTGTGSARGPSRGPAGGRAPRDRRVVDGGHLDVMGRLQAARRKARPVRPNPLIATLTAIVDISIASRGRPAPPVRWSHRPPDAQ